LEHFTATDWELAPDVLPQNNFLQAVQWLAEGSYVRRRAWPRGQRIGSLSPSTALSLTPEDMEAVDWEKLGATRMHDPDENIGCSGGAA
jgi:hypothetical protein